MGGATADVTVNGAGDGAGGGVAGAAADVTADGGEGAAGAREEAGRAGSGAGGTAMPVTLAIMPTSAPGMALLPACPGSK